MLVLSQLSSLLKVNHWNLLQEDGARLDVVARDFWGRNRQRAFFDGQVFNPFARSYAHSQLSSYMNVRSDGHMMNALERLRELAFHL